MVCSRLKVVLWAVGSARTMMPNRRQSTLTCDRRRELGSRYVIYLSRIAPLTYFQKPIPAKTPPTVVADVEPSTASQHVAAPIIATPDMSGIRYNQENSIHKKIVSSATKAMKAYSVNTKSVSTQADRRSLIEEELEKLATRHYHHAGKSIRTQGLSRILIFFSVVRQ